MNIKIKKKYVGVGAGFVCLVSGIFLAQILIDALSVYRAWGFILPVLFIVSLVWIIVYERNNKITREIAKEVSRQVVAEYSKKMDYINIYQQDEWEKAIYEHLVNKYNNEDYIIFNKRK